jgi:hypothetical protein
MNANGRTHDRDAWSGVLAVTGAAVLILSVAQSPRGLRVICQRAGHASRRLAAQRPGVSRHN